MIEEKVLKMVQEMYNKATKKIVAFRQTTTSIISCSRVLF